MSLQLPTQTEAADQQLNAAIHDARTLLRVCADQDALNHDAHMCAAFILEAATVSADRILGHATRPYPQTFRIGSPNTPARGH